MKIIAPLNEWKTLPLYVEVPALWMRNSGVRILQIICLPSDHLSKSPRVTERCCLYHAASSSASLNLPFIRTSIWTSALGSGPVSSIQMQVLLWEYKKLNPSTSERKKKKELRDGGVCLRHRGACFWCITFFFRDHVLADVQVQESTPIPFQTTSHSATKLKYSLLPLSAIRKESILAQVPANAKLLVR